MTPQAGRVLSGRYRLVRPIGHGSQASVWAAEHLALGTEVAVKLIDPELAKREEARERFRREATSAAQLRSTHVVQILDHGIDDDQPFIVMEVLEGEDLFDRLSKRGRLTVREASTMLIQVARALSRAHQAGVVHRDLKPENVFIVQNDDEEVVKVLDFGVAKLSYAERVTMQGAGSPTLIGTPQYMSPEQVRGDADVDFRTDIWALGVLAYQCVVGDLPFDSDKLSEVLLKITMRPIPVPSRVDPTVPQTFDAWFARSCDRDPTRRFGSARSQAEALARVADLAPDAAKHSLPPPRPLGRTGVPGSPALPPRPSVPSKARPAYAPPPSAPDPTASSPTLVTPFREAPLREAEVRPAAPSYDELAQTVQMAPRDLPMIPAKPHPPVDAPDTEMSGPPSGPRKHAGDLDWGAASLSLPPPPTDVAELELLHAAQLGGRPSQPAPSMPPPGATSEPDPPRGPMDSSLQTTTEAHAVRQRAQRNGPFLFLLVVVLFAALAGGLALGAYHLVQRVPARAP